MFKRKVVVLPSNKKDELNAHAVDWNTKFDFKSALQLASSSKKIMDTTTTSVAVWLKQRKEGKARIEKKKRGNYGYTSTQSGGGGAFAIPNTKIRRKGHYVTRDRNQIKKKKERMQERNLRSLVSSDTLRSQALDNALDRELGRRLSAQRLKLGI